jgi:GTP pyrophosphokinase
MKATHAQRVDPDAAGTASSQAGPTREPDPAGAPECLPDWARPAFVAASADARERLVELLPLLDRLSLDATTRAAAIAHVLAAWPDADHAHPGAGALREGLAEAQRIRVLHAGRPAGSAEGLRRLLLAIVRDLRVVFILLALQLVELRQAGRLPEAERRELARLAGDIHAPLANRLGIWQLKWELEDLAFRYLNPDTYKRIARLLDERRSDRERYIADATRVLADALREARIEAEVSGRPKHIFSIWKKMSRKNAGFGELYDVRAIRVMCHDVAACYAALGIVHSLWTPIPQEFDDYIARPKGNHYQSLHTAVVGPEGKTLEVQIRTHDMHAHAELGVAAHWKYKEGGQGDAAFERKIAWLRALLENREAGEDDAGLYEGFRTDTIDDRIYVLTPRGEVIDLPVGGTVLDFAYHVHTEVGHRCRGAKVNGRIVPLTHQPQSGDRIEILTAKESAPSRDWLNPQAGFLASGRARDKVRAWFRRVEHDTNVREGAAVLDRELKRLGLHDRPLEPLLPRWHLARIEDLHVAVALGEVTASQVARALHEAEAPRVAEDATPARARTPAAPARDAIVVEGVGNLLMAFARCCRPLPGDPIVGYVTLGRGVSVHRHDCRSFARMAAAHPDRVMPVGWGERSAGQFEVDLRVVAWDRSGLLKDITAVFANAKVPVLALNTRLDSDHGEAEITCKVRVRDVEQLGGVLARLGAVPTVQDAQRIA